MRSYPFFPVPDCRYNVKPRRQASTVSASAEKREREPFLAATGKEIPPLLRGWGENALAAIFTVLLPVSAALRPVGVVSPSVGVPRPPNFLIWVASSASSELFFQFIREKEWWCVVSAPSLLQARTRTYRVYLAAERHHARPLACAAGRQKLLGKVRQKWNIGGN